LISLRKSLLLLPLLAVGLRGDGPSRYSSFSLSQFIGYPPVTLWAWERPEDLRFVDPTKYAVAYLDQTIFLTPQVRARTRRQPLLVSRGTKLTAVVRIEAPQQFAARYPPGILDDTVALVMNSADRPGVSALQIDFDATVSQRTFYRDLLRKVRRSMPRGMPLSITALASWCAWDDWISDLPVDEAVPMFFRMGRDSNHADQPGWTYPIREPLCESSAGVASDEAWPTIGTGKRIYIFHPRSWNFVALSNVQELLPQ
jgi:hypothetical protein